eukprot:scaffold325722_cov53-Tisochrysis_lutea.AAC.1
MLLTPTLCVLAALALRHGDGDGDVVASRSLQSGHNEHAEGVIVESDVNLGDTTRHGRNAREG